MTTYFNSDLQLAMIQAIVESYDEYDVDCGKIDKIKEILNLNKTIEKRDVEKSTLK